MTFNEKIIRLRKIKGLTQGELASAVGVSRQAVYKWESGQSYPEVAKLLELKILFNISIDDLLDDNYEIALPEKKKKRRLSAVAKAEVEEAAKAELNVSEEIHEEAPAAAELEEAAPAAEVAPVAEQLKEEVKEEPKEEKKKIGFFSRLFGRR